MSTASGKSSASGRKAELPAALASCRSALLTLAAASALVNVLYLTGSFYMLMIYDRVIPSQSIPTLVGLSMLALGLFAFQGVLDFLRGRILVRVAGSFGHDLGTRVYGVIPTLALTTRSQGDGLQPMRDLDQIRQFMSGTGRLRCAIFRGCRFISRSALHFTSGSALRRWSVLFCSRWLPY